VAVLAALIRGLRGSIVRPMRRLVAMAILLLVASTGLTAESSEQLLERGQRYENDGQWSLASATYHELLENDPTNAVAHYRLGIVLDSLGMTSHAIASYREALRLSPDMAEARQAIEGHFVSKANAARRAGNRDGAIAALKEGVDANPKALTARLELGQELQAAGDLAGAAAQYEAASSAHPDDGTAHARLAAVSAKRGDHERAAREWREVLRINGRDPVAHHGLAVAYEAQGKRDDALAATQQAIRYYMIEGREDKAIEMTVLESKLLTAGAQPRPTPRRTRDAADREE
jgi:tetratricopeptide (TPR) repeat protein